MARVFAVTLTFTFFLFVNVAASLSATAAGSSHPLAGTVGFFQLVTNVVFIGVALVLAFKVVRRLARRMVEISDSAQAEAETYPFVDAPLNPHSAGWRIVDTKPMSPIADEQVYTYSPVGGVQPVQPAHDRNDYR